MRVSVGSYEEEAIGLEERERDKNSWRSFVQPSGALVAALVFLAPLSSELCPLVEALFSEASGQSARCRFRLSALSLWLRLLVPRFVVLRALAVPRA